MNSSCPSTLTSRTFTLQADHVIEPTMNVPKASQYSTIIKECTIHASYILDFRTPA